MSGIRTGTVTSADGTVIAVDQYGAGPAVVLVQGALNDRADPVMSALAAGLSRRLAVFSYDRRGRGGSGDTQPYAAERETEDLAAVIVAAGGSAAVFGGSSGAGLALRAATGNPAITRLALWEPPCHTDDSAPALPDDFAEQLERLVRAGRRADAVECFLLRAAQVSPEDVAALRGQPSWPAMEAAAPSLAYEAYVMGPGNALPHDLLAGITQPVLVLSGSASPAWMGRGPGRRGRHPRSRAPGPRRAGSRRGPGRHRPRAAGVPHHVLTRGRGPSRAAGRRNRSRPASAGPARGPAAR